MFTLIILVVAFICYMTVVVIILRKKAHVAAVRRLIEQNDDNVSQMKKAMNEGNWDRFDRYYWRSTELGELIDREIERL